MRHCALYGRLRWPIPHVVAPINSIPFVSRSQGMISASVSEGRDFTRVNAWLNSPRFATSYQKKRASA
jgi:hypothetical protein